MNHLAQLNRRIRRAVLARRRLLAGLSAAAAVAFGLQAAAEPPPPRVPVLVAARDLPGGTVLRSSDLETAEFAPDSIPSGVVSAAKAIGRTTAAPVGSGEPLTDVRLVSGSMLEGYPGMVAAPVRIGDAGAVALLRVGDRVDVLAADPQGSSDTAVVVADDAPVISLPDEPDMPGAAPQGGLVVLAVPPATAQVVAAAAVSGYLSIVIDH